MCHIFEDGSKSLCRMWYEWGITPLLVLHCYNFRQWQASCMHNASIFIAYTQRYCSTICFCKNISLFHLLNTRYDNNMSKIASNRSIVDVRSCIQFGQLRKKTNKLKINENQLLNITTGVNSKFYLEFPSIAMESNKNNETFVYLAESKKELMGWAWKACIWLWWLCSQNICVSWIVTYIYAHHEFTAAQIVSS